MATCGVYIAHHRWLDLDYGPGQLYKVGHTADLGARLGDGAYATCFPPGWRYVATFELPTREEAARRGAKVLFSIVSYAQTAVPPETMGEGPAGAIPAALSRAGMTLVSLAMGVSEGPTALSRPLGAVKALPTRSAST